MRLARRAFLAGAGALLGAPAAAQVQGGPDVVVVGAGLAGLAAARGLILEGFRVQVIEARDRIGGRALTASGALGVPFDRGAARLYEAESNPLSDLIRHLGFLPVPDAERPRLYLDGVPASAARVEAIERAMARLTEAMAEAAEKGRDVSAASLAATPLAAGTDRWHEIAAALVGPLSAAVELADLSVLDWYRQAGTENGAVLADGLGTAVTAFGQGLPVRLRTAAQTVRWDGRGVVVATDAGEIAARAVVLTAPTPVLDHGIRFDPVLPEWKRAAIEALPLGAMEKVAIRFSRNVFDLPDNAGAVLHSLPEPVVQLDLRPFGRELAVATLGADAARESARMAVADRIGWLRGYLREYYGRAVDDAFVAGDATDWSGDLWAGGAFSAQRPGQGGARAALARPVDNRLFFAGEACDDLWATQLAGAYRSGLRAAAEVAGALR